MRCIKGALFDVAVDIRHGSPTFGQWVGVELSAENGQQLWVPPGMAHGFMTLKPDTMIAYKVTAPYSAENDRGLRWNDPAIGISRRKALIAFFLTRTKAADARRYASLFPLSRAGGELMRVLITGGAGFIGSALVRYLVSDIGAEVLNVDKLTYAGNLASLKPIAERQTIAFYRQIFATNQRLPKL